MISRIREQKASHGCMFSTQATRPNNVTPLSSLSPALGTVHGEIEDNDGDWVTIIEDQTNTVSQTRVPKQVSTMRFYGGRPTGESLANMTDPSEFFVEGKSIYGSDFVGGKPAERRSESMTRAPTSTRIDNPAAFSKTAATISAMPIAAQQSDIASSDDYETSSISTHPGTLLEMSFPMSDEAISAASGRTDLFLPNFSRRLVRMEKVGSSSDVSHSFATDLIDLETAREIRRKYQGSGISDMPETNTERWRNSPSMPVSLWATESIARARMSTSPLVRAPISSSVIGHLASSSSIATLWPGTSMEAGAPVSSSYQQSYIQGQQKPEYWEDIPIEDIKVISGYITKSLTSRDSRLLQGSVIEENISEDIAHRITKKTKRTFHNRFEAIRNIKTHFVSKSTLDRTTSESTHPTHSSEITHDATLQSTQSSEPSSSRLVEENLSHNSVGFSDSLEQFKKSRQKFSQEQLQPDFSSHAATTAVLPSQLEVSQDSRFYFGVQNIYQSIRTGIFRGINSLTSPSTTSHLPSSLFSTRGTRISSNPVVQKNNRISRTDMPRDIASMYLCNNDEIEDLPLHFDPHSPCHTAGTGTSTTATLSGHSTPAPCPFLIRRSQEVDLELGITNTGKTNQLRGHRFRSIHNYQDENTPMLSAPAPVARTGRYCYLDTTEREIELADMKSYHHPTAVTAANFSTHTFTSDTPARLYPRGSLYRPSFVSTSAMRARDRFFYGVFAACCVIPGLAFVVSASVSEIGLRISNFESKSNINKSRKSRKSRSIGSNSDGGGCLEHAALPYLTRGQVVRFTEHQRSMLQRLALAWVAVLVILLVIVIQKGVEYARSK